MHKFLQRLQPARARRVIPILRRIELNELTGLDIKPILGMKDIFRCRIGDIRIIFRRHSTGNTIIDADYRRDIYRRLKR